MICFLGAVFTPASICASQCIGTEISYISRMSFQAIPGQKTMEFVGAYGIRPFRIPAFAAMTQNSAMTYLRNF